MATSSAYDALIVGGGMAGLTSAAYLSRAGLGVLLCEKEKTIGGLVSSFEHNGFVFDGGIRAIENSGIVRPMLRQLGVEVDFLPSDVSIGIGRDVVRISSRDSLQDYEELLDRHFPENTEDIARIIQETRNVTGYLDVLYGIENPLFLDLRRNPAYVLKTILPWMFKYLLTMPKIGKRRRPVYEHLSYFTTNPALIDVIAQHFFHDTPAFFALSYFSLYLDYKYPRGGTGALPRAIEQFIVRNNGEIKRETRITSVDPSRHQAVDANGNTYQYRKLIWAADLKTLYRLVSLGSLTDSNTTRSIQARQNAVSAKIGGDSVFTVYLTLDLPSTYFEEIHGAHHFHTPSVSGLSQCDPRQLSDDGKSPAGLTCNKATIVAWLERFLDLTTYEVSCPALRDSALAPEGKTGLIVSSLFDFSLTKHISEMGWYQEFKTLMTDGIIRVLDTSIYPGLKAAVIDSFTSTPLTIERLSGNSEGAITGWAFTNESMPAVNSLPRVASSVETPIPDTYQAGQWTYSPSGLPISILTGKLAADRILKDLR